MTNRQEALRLTVCEEPYDAIVGVDVDGAVEAHAWLAFEAGARTYRFRELARIPAQREPGIPCDVGWFRP